MTEKIAQGGWLPPYETRAHWARPIAFETRTKPNTSPATWRIGYDIEGHLAEMICLGTGDGYYRADDGSWRAGTIISGRLRVTKCDNRHAYNIVRGMGFPPFIEVPATLKVQPETPPIPGAEIVRPGQVPEKRRSI